jgi:methionyl-tRNA formyltransferase
MQDNRTFQRLRILFFGMQGAFSTPSLQALLNSNIDVCAVVVPVTPIPGRSQQAIQQRKQPHGKHISLPLVSQSPSIIDIAWKQNIPVWEVSRLSDVNAYEMLAAYEPDILCVACFSQRIPRSILDLPRLGCLNVHPSLLPAHRGPVPLFWIFRNGEATTGVTIHYLAETMDTGDILAQQTIPVPEGIDYDQLEMECATSGGTLLAHVAHALYEGGVTPMQQDEAKSSYESFPTHDDFLVKAEEWDAQRAYNFINGVKHWDEPIEVSANNEVFLTRECVSYSLNSIDKQVRGQHIQTVQERVIVCRNGWVKIRLL